MHADEIKKVEPILWAIFAAGIAGNGTVSAKNISAKADQMLDMWKERFPATERGED